MVFEGIKHPTYSKLIIITYLFYLTYYKQGQCITKTGFIQFVDSLGELFVFIDDVFELKNKMRLSDLIDVRFV